MKKKFMLLSILGASLAIVAIGNSSLVVKADAWNGEAWNYLGSWNGTSTFTDKGVEMTIKGADTVGSSEAWKQTAYINNNVEWADLQNEFSIADGKKVTIEYSVVFYSEDNQVLSQSGNGTGLYLKVLDAANDSEIEQIKIWTDAGGYGNTNHSYQLYAENGNWTDFSNGKWVMGDAKESSSFTFTFDSENYLMSYVGGSDELVRLANDAFYAHVGACSATNIKFQITGDNGFTKDTKVILKSINGHSLAKTTTFYNVSIDGVVQKVEEGQVAEVSVPTREHYQFVKWIDGEGNEVDLTQPVTQDIEVTALWAPVKYNVTFGENTSQLDYDSEIAIPEGPAKEADAQYSYAFDGWYNGEEKLVAGTKVTGDVTYVARYTSTVNKYDVTFGETSIKLAYGTVITAPEGPAKDADEDYTYTFKGWFDEDNNQLQEGATVTGNVVYHAEYDRVAKEKPSEEPSVEPSEEPSEQPSEQPSVEQSVAQSEEVKQSEETKSEQPGSVISQPEVKKGCKGEAATSLFGLLAIAAALVFKKRK